MSATTFGQHGQHGQHGQPEAQAPETALQRYLVRNEVWLVLLSVVAMGALVLSFVGTVRANSVSAGGGGGPGLNPTVAAAAKTVYSGSAGNCGSCHGSGGGGGVGPKLNDGAVTKTFPDPLDQVRWVIVGSDGGGAVYAKVGKTPKGGMPAFGAKLTLTEIVHVVLHERQTLAGQPLSADAAAWQGLGALIAEFPDRNYSEAEVAALLAEIGPPPAAEGGEATTTTVAK